MTDAAVLAEWHRWLTERQLVCNRFLKDNRVVRRQVWSKLSPHTDKNELDWNYSTVVVHHSGNWGVKSPVEIEEKHIAGNGWSDVGYHLMIAPDGTVYEGCSLIYKGAHVRKANTGKIGILVMGDFQHQWWDLDDDPTQRQMTSLVRIILGLKREFPGIQTLAGHRDFQDTECPGDELYKRLPEVRNSTSLMAPAGQQVGAGK
jgi:hypothetical protein